MEEERQQHADDSDENSLTDLASHIPKRIDVHIHVWRVGHIGNIRIGDTRYFGRIDAGRCVIGDLTRNFSIRRLRDLPTEGGNIAVNKRLSFKESLPAKEDDIAVDFAVNRQVAAEDGNVTVDDSTLFNGEISAEDGDRAVNFSIFLNFNIAAKDCNTAI